MKFLQFHPQISGQVLLASLERNILLPIFLTLRPTQAVHVVPHRAVGHVPLPGTGHRHAAGGVGTLILAFRELPAESAHHVDDEVLLGFEVFVL